MLIEKGSKMKPPVTEYVAGFLFDLGAREVVLVKKARPDWQAGLYNGVGGKIEPGETPEQAMQREFMEEANHLRTDWEQFCVLRGADFTVYFFRAFIRIGRLADLVETNTDEPIEVIWLDLIKVCNAVSNLQWLIPMALHRSRSFDVVEAA